MCFISLHTIHSLGDLILNIHQFSPWPFYLAKVIQPLFDTTQGVGNCDGFTAPAKHTYCNRHSLYNDFVSGHLCQHWMIGAIGSVEKKQLQIPLWTNTGWPSSLVIFPDLSRDVTSPRCYVQRLLETATETSSQCWCCHLINRNCAVILFSDVTSITSRNITLHCTVVLGLLRCPTCWFPLVA